MKPFIKICGLRDPFQAQECARSGASAVGVVFFEKSPRNIDLYGAKKVCASLPEDMISTGVFVDESYDFIMNAVRTCDLKAVQLHGSEPPRLAMKIADHGIKVIKALFRVKDPLFSEIASYDHVWAFLLEKGDGNLPGGNAEKWDWDISVLADKGHRIIIAGGLESGNVAEALATSGAFGVDVSSGVESSPGIKDLRQVKQFIKEVKMGKPAGEIL